MVNIFIWGAVLDSKTYKKAKKNKWSAKKVFGVIFLVLGAFAFLFCCIPNFLNIGNFFQGLFGVLAYPLALLLALVGVALIMNLRYTLNRRYGFYLTISIICLLSLLHIIFTTNVLYDKLTDFKHMGAYLKSCYFQSNGITIGGVTLGVFVFTIRALIGLMGSYAFFGIFATVFVGLTIDYIIYSKKKDRRLAKLTREPVLKTIDAPDDIFDSGEKVPYSFEKEEFDQKDESTWEDYSDNKSTFTSLFEQTDNKTEELLASDDKIGFSFDEKPVDVKEEAVNFERDRAKSVLFGNGSLEDLGNNDKKENENNEPKSARDILFGDGPKVPNIFERSNEERNAWRKEYSSKTLSFKDEDEIKEEKQENINPFVNNQNNDGSINTSWGTYRPTSSFGSSNNQTIDSLQTSNQVRRDVSSIRDNNLNAFKENAEVEKTEPRINNGFDRSRLRERTSVSNFNRMNVEPEEDNTDFTSRFTSHESRTRGGDLLANAASLGIEMKEESTFGSILDQSEKEEPVIKQEKPKVEKISFENQLNRKYNAPPTSLLNVVKEEKVDYSLEYKKKSAILENTLSNFKIPAKVINVVRGPKVTRYELSMPTGIPVSRVLSYDKDMSMNLASRSGVRIEAPIPGKNAFGVEVENDKASMVGLKELVESPEFKTFKNPLAVAIGKNISGETIIKSLSKMVHVLVAGSTGSGKSVFLHSLIMSLMYKHSPEELRFIMIDPKRVECSRYNIMAHMKLHEIVTECSKAINALSWAVKEMERRYELLMQNECQKLEQFNECEAVKQGREKKMPYLVIVVDELAELMSVAAKDAETKIQRITQLGRAAGIHMVVATQRPSVNVVTGTIKNNLPTRIAFALASAVDSGTIINQGGAEKLLGQGDMLLSAQDSNQLVRLQAAFVSDEEIKKTLTYIKEHNVSVYDEEIQKSIYAEPEKEENVDDGSGSSVGSNEDKMDEYMPQALKLVMKNGKASISMIQRRFSVGYARAARIIDQMETRGFIDGGIGNKPRDVKITVEEYNELFGNFDED